MICREIPIDFIEILQRARSDIGDISQIVESARSNIGQIQSIAVKETHDGKYELIAGFRRLEAFKEAGLKTVIVRIYPEELSYHDNLQIELIENLARLDLTWSDQISLEKKIHKLQVKKDEKWRQQDTADVLGKSRVTVTEDLDLATACEHFPALKDCTSKHDARKVLSRMQEQIVIAELSSRSESKAKKEGGMLEQLSNGYRTGDFFRCDLEAGTFDFIDADPDYGIDFKTLGRNSNSTTSNQKFLKGLSVKDYNQISIDDYPEFLLDLLSHCEILMKPNAWMVLWADTAHMWRNLIFDLCHDIGLDICSVPAVWSKGISRNAAPNMRLSSSYEIFWYIRKGKADLKKIHANTFDFPAVRKDRIHPTEKPIELMREIIETFTDPHANILIPFLGSGATLTAAITSGRSAVGYELSKEYRDAFIERSSRRNFDI